MSTITRRSLFGLAAAATAAATAGCTGVAGSGGAGGGGSANTSVRFAWWGNNVRQQNYMTAFEQFGEDHPEISIEPEFADYSPYQERMTTQMAARNVPDIFWVPSPNVLTYYSNGLYHDISEIETLDLADYDQEDLDSFMIDGSLNTMPFASTTPVVRVNQDFADADDVRLPEPDEPWSWDDLAEFARDYSKEQQQRKALSYYVDHDLTFESWLRQRGEDLWSEDGTMGFSQEGLADWIDWWEKLRKAGATTSLSEQDGPAPDWGLVGDKILMTCGSSNHLIDDAEMFPDYTFTLRQPPAPESAESGHRFIYTPRMAIYAEIDESKLDAAGTLLNFCTNNVEMIKTVGLTMGAPVNPRVAEEMREFASDNEKQCLDMVGAAREADRRPRFEAPPGSSTWRDVMQRECERVALEGVPVGRAAKAIISEIDAGLKRAA